MKLDPVFCFFLLCTIIGATLVIFQFSKTVQMKKRQGCIRKTTGIITKGRESSIPHSSTWRSVEYLSLDGVKHTINIDIDFIDSPFFSAKKDDVVPIWYDPEKPNNVFIGETRKIVESLPQAKKRLLMLVGFTIICAAILLMKSAIIVSN